MVHFDQAPFESLLRSIVYLNWMCHPSLPRQLANVRLFFHAHTARNVIAFTQGGGKLPGWHVLPAGKASRCAAAATPINESHAGSSATFHSACDASLAEAERVILFFHGVGGCRGGWGLPAAAPSGRVSCKRALATHFNCHVVCFEYRGFGDATDYGTSIAPVPSEQTISEDATAAWEWLVSRVGPNCKVVFYAQSLGCAVAVRLASELMQPKSTCARRLGLVLDAPFTSLIAAAAAHPFGQFAARMLGLVGFNSTQRAAVIAAVFARLSDSWENEQRIAALAQGGVALLLICKAEDEVVPSSMPRELNRLASLGRAGSSLLASPAPRLAVIAGRSKVMKRHHVDACTTPEWLVAVGDFMDEL